MVSGCSDGRDGIRNVSVTANQCIRRYGVELIRKNNINCIITMRPFQYHNTATAAPATVLMAAPRRENISAAS